MIFVALQEKVVELRIGYGVEWILDKKETEEIVSLFLPYFKDSKFYEGLEAGVRGIKEKLSGISWEVCDQKDYREGCIKKLRIKDVVKIEDQSVEVEIEDGTLFNVFYTDFMQSLKSKPLVEFAKKEMYVRLKSKNEGLFLGIDQ